jgi:hypothetical protein
VVGAASLQASSHTATLIRGGVHRSGGRARFLELSGTGAQNLDLRGKHLTSRLRFGVAGTAKIQVNWAVQG